MRTIRPLSLWQNPRPVGIFLVSATGCGYRRHQNQQLRRLYLTRSPFGDEPYRRKVGRSARLWRREKSSSQRDQARLLPRCGVGNMTEAGSCRGGIFVLGEGRGVRETLSAILRRNGYEVAGFAEGQSFLAAARAREPSCILLDVHLPGRSGLEILKDLNAEEYAVPILMISGTGDIPMAVEAIKHGALDFIEKPFRANTVSTAVQDAIVAWSRRPSNKGARSHAMTTTQLREYALLLRRWNTFELGSVPLGS